MISNYKFITGKAGTGKTSHLINNIKRYGPENCIILSPTHSSLNVIRERLTREQFYLGNVLSNNNPKEVYKINTLHSFFGIDENGQFNKPSIRLSLRRNIFIDEVGLIPKTIFETMLAVLNSSGQTIDNLFLYGDILQLSPIDRNNEYVSYEIIDKLEKLSTGGKIIPGIIKHYDKSIISSDSFRRFSVEILLTNYRSNDKIISILNNIYKNNIIDEKLFIKFDQVIDLIKNKGYVFISSRYKILNRINSLLNDSKENTQKNITIQGDRIQEIVLKENDLYMITINTKDYNNGDLFAFKSFNGSTIQGILSNGEEIQVNKVTNENKSYYPIIPGNLLTVHKSQGREYKNVIVCYEDLFEISMLYTAITRSKENIFFYSSNGNNFFKETRVSEFNELEDIIYRDLSNKK